ncbi:MAG TPA: hypothetical protein VFK69_06450 [Candidatus Eisenbacteria bacterium]|nr:hypothetical protein [Candidatus Eisenbacteria bacterium]
MHRRLLVLPLLAIVLLPHAARAAWSTDPSVNTPLSTANSTPRRLPAMVADGNGGAFAVWTEQTQLRAQRLDARGNALWGAGGAIVCNTGFVPDSAVAVADGAGGIVVAWRDFRNASQPDVYAQRVNGAGVPQWTANGVAVCTDPSAQGQIAMCADDSSGAVIVWQDMRNNASGGSDVFAQRVLANGVPNWTPNGVEISQIAATQRHPQIVSGGTSGIYYAVWEDNRNAQGFDLYVSRITHQGGMLSTTAGQALVTATNDQVNAVLAPDGAGGLFAAWEDDRNLASTGRDIYAQHFSSGLNNITSLWNLTNPVIVCSAAVSQVSASILPDGAGGLFLAWQDSRGGVGSDDIYAQRLNASGVAQWAANGVVVSAAAQVQSEPHLVSDGASGFVAEFLDARAVSTMHDVFAQRMNPSGVAQWTADGVGLMVYPADDVRPAVAVSDGRGGIIVGCQETRLANTDLFAQRADRYGFLGNTEPYLTRVSDVPNDQGGKVKLQWDASDLEFDPLSVVTTYDIFRSAPAAIARAELLGARRISRDPQAARLDPARTLYRDGVTDYAWEFETSVTALDVSSYSYIASTTGDSIAGSNPPTVFMVQGRGASGRYWSSAPDSGYSVDNLAPATPAPLTGNYAAGATHLHWDRNLEADLADYHVYRGASADFAPGPGNLIAAPADTGYADVGAAGSYYKLSAVDVHGNESGFALLQPGATSAAPGVAPPALALSAPRPTPAIGDAEIRFALPHAGRVTLAIYDVSGRRVRTLLAGELAAGAHAARLAGAPAAPGLYVIRLDTPWGSRARSFMWLR